MYESPTMESLGGDELSEVDGGAAVAAAAVAVVAVAATVAAAVNVAAVETSVV